MEVKGSLMTRRTLGSALGPGASWDAIQRYENLTHWRSEPSPLENSLNHLPGIRVGTEKWHQSRPSAIGHLPACRQGPQIASEEAGMRLDSIR